MEGDRSNATYEDILKLFKQLDDPKRTDIVFFLMSIPPDSIDVLTKYIDTMKQQAAKDGGYHDFTIPIFYGDSPWGGITYVIGRDLEGTMSRLEAISSMNKYRTKADRWLSLGARIDGVLGLVAFNDSPWRQTQDMDEALEFYTKNTHGKQIEINRNAG